MGMGVGTLWEESHLALGSHGDLCQSPVCPGASSDVSALSLIDWPQRLISLDRDGPERGTTIFVLPGQSRHSVGQTQPAPVTTVEDSPAARVRNRLGQPVAPLSVPAGPPWSYGNRGWGIHLGPYKESIFWATVET